MRSYPGNAWEKKASPKKARRRRLFDHFPHLALARTRPRSRQGLEKAPKDGAVGALIAVTASSNREASIWAPLPTFDLRWYLNTYLDSDR